MSLSQEQQAVNTNPCIDSGNPVLPAMSSSTTRNMGTAAKPNVSGLLYKTTSSDYGRLPLTSTSVMQLSQEQQPKDTNPFINSGNPHFPFMSSSAIRSMGSAARPNVRNPLYKTTSSEYGRLPPTVETAPCSYHPKSNRFSKDQSKGGMYQNNSFNTALDRSRVHDCWQHIF